MLDRVVFEGHGPPAVMRVVHEDLLPSPGDDEVLVRVAYAGVNFLDLYQRSGAYTVRFPFTPGIEGSGVVVAAGAGVTGVAEGDRVAWAGAPGSYASHCLIPADRIIPVPAGVGLADAATVLIQGMTAHFLAADVVPLRAGDICLVHAAAGGVGGLLTQFAALRGATVIGTVSSEAKVATALAAGAEHVIDYGREDFAERVREITGGRGVDVVYDAVGQETFERGLASLRPRGTFVLYGQTGGAVGAVDPQALNAKGSLFFTKASLSHYDRTRAAMLERAAEVFEHVMDGRLRLRVHGTYSLEQAVAAHEALEARTVIGKVLLQPS
ncbi:NADPH2:quinone reductase [Allocatelliglobosispora scoriae]|uniref:NADPH2:quinone reductase n=1 Tax=Allocatelliglobosispora scoriae TaxID=643052 RepID=A0A841C0W8_9ACTN|nr:quinone oxidoreductase [Allocatelliglobosispora scoriae]MBB5872702.1 NADPH2:quinone reductase [Allocatelliglobosispora scoriae]